MPQPTDQQLANRSNPIPGQLVLPGGMFFDTNDYYKTTLYSRNPDGTYQAWDIGSLAINAAGGSDAFWKTHMNQSGAAQREGLRILKEQYGIDVDSIPSQTFADAGTLRQQGKIVTGSIPSLQTAVQSGIPKGETQYQPFNTGGGGSGGTTNSDITALQTNASLTTSGNYARTPNGIVDVRTGQMVAPLQQSVGSPNTGNPGTSTGNGGFPVPTDSSAEFDRWLAGQNLPADQQEAIKAIYGAVVANDTQAASRISSAMAAASKYSDPFFKAQVRLVTDALSRGLSSKEGDLSFQSDQLKNSLADLRRDIAASKDNMALDHMEELNNLEAKYQDDLETTDNDLASRGFTSSSARNKADSLLEDNYGSMVESSNRAFSFKNQQFDNALSSGERDSALQIANLQRLTSEGKLDALRSAEEKVGSQTLAGLGYSNLLGDVGGEIPRQQVEDALGFANSFVF